MKYNKHILLTVFALFYGLFLIQTINARNEGKISGKITDGKIGISGIVVSDGFTVTTTNDSGTYQMPRNPLAKFVFVSIPSEYKIPTEQNIPVCYIPIDSTQTTFKANFQLSKSSVENNFTWIAMCDPQVSNESELNRFKNETVAELATLPSIFPIGTAIYGVALGDLVWDKIPLFEKYKAAMSTIPFPFFSVIGNHDHDEKFPDNDRKASWAFEKNMGPTYYSFNRGACHFVILDAVNYFGGRKNYTTDITPEQLAWLKQDLQYVDKNKLIFICTHVPSKRRHEGGISNRDELYKLLEGYNVRILSGHTHICEQVAISPQMNEHNIGAACGAFWSGDICGDGTPNGYVVYTIQGNSITNQYYKGTGKDKNYQIKLYPRGSWEEKPDCIIANIWNWQDDWKIEVYENDVLKGTMIQYRGYDPDAFATMEGDDKPKAHPKAANPNLTDHLFYYVPSKGDVMIKVVATDPYGNVYSESIVAN